MKKIKKSIVEENKTRAKSLFKPEVKSSRITIDSRVSNVDKFNSFFQLIDNTKDFKNSISQYCFTNIISLVYNYSEFLKNYNEFDSSQLNSWERQTIFQEIAGHYSETASRYLNKAKFIVTNPKANINNIAKLINNNSALNIIDNKYQLDFNIEDKLTQLNDYLINYQSNLALEQHNLSKLDNLELIEKTTKEINKLERLIKSYKKLISDYKLIHQFKLNKQNIYNRLIDLILAKKIRLISKVKLAEYKTGTHARHLDNAQISIAKDLDNREFQYFLKVRKNDKLVSREPKLTAKNKDIYQELLAKHNENNFIYLPITYNKRKLKQIGKDIDSILTKDNPQILIKSEQLRIGSSSRKIHIIFNYEQSNPLGNLIESTMLEKKNSNFLNPTVENTLGLDVNLKHNLLLDSNGNIYDGILKNSKLKFIHNLNEIVLLQSKPQSDRTEKEKYRFEKLLRVNESLLKDYLSGLIKDWKSKNILHLVLEDLNIINDKSYYQHKDVKIKYSRLARLIRLNNIKTWIAQMAEKQQMFTHFVNSAYTSQECNICHYISPNNRQKQEVFKCTNPSCKHEENADNNSAKSIKSRLLNVNIRKKLGKDNVYQCSRAISIYYKNVKNIVEEEYQTNGVVTELLSVAKLKIAKLKEAPCFSAG